MTPQKKTRLVLQMTEQEKETIRSRANRNRQSMVAYCLSQLLPPPPNGFPRMNQALPDDLHGAIEESRMKDKISHLPYSDEYHEALLGVCDDWTDAGEVQEYWARDWRVHLELAQ
jgi:hypothetical protein